MSLDRALLRVLANHATAAAEAMGWTLLRTAHSTFVKETEDFTCQLLTPEGLTFASPKNFGAHWFTGLDYGPAIALIEEGYEEGDIAITSDPYSGFVATHAPDTHLWKPVFHDGALVCFVGCHVHNTDVGGAVPASLSRSLTEVHQEGLRIPPMKLARRGVLNQELLRLIATNVRLPAQNRGDLGAQIAAVNTGERRVREMIARFGLPALQAAMPALLDYAEAQARRVIAGIPDGDYAYADYADEDSPGGRPCRIALTVRVRGGEAELDFTGSDPQLASSLNVPTGGRERHALAMVGLTLVLSTLEPDLLLNYGVYRPARAVLPPGTVLNAQAPAAVGMRSLTCMLAQAVTLGAFAQALPERLTALPAAGPSLVNVRTSDRAGRSYMASIGPIGGGGGGAARADADDGGGSLFGFIRNTPVEITEAELPIRVLRYGTVPDSGGPGLHRGGTAAAMEFQVFAPGSVVTARNRDRSVFASPGILGGRPGAPALFTRTPPRGTPIDLGNTDVVPCGPGDTILITGAGGGGYGDPFARPVEAVLQDVAGGLVSAGAARRDYGVALGADGALDAAETARLRAAPRLAPAGFFTLCATREGFERIWTPARYAALTELLATLPVHWRHFVKLRLFEAVTEPGSAADIAAAFAALGEAHPELRAP
ncbi:hydantoinase B/oxoprolinase family protein [Paracraurococcus ruber]|uniref:Hydantoin utilization protein B n=1 Tax=Paracraurococcus ruber TaxID=77675 RepID=A0ABS1CVG5_9PROT|nr:hydantoinase B/oxoprolinase family protein [Paracraurococcus ruber]MBK1658405.1 hydantoin utilization protein B [Paracraurococcus ruber]TDG30754.1 hydantoinase B/oxoprolinase family protein [Paracraurococcus ruber]